MEAVRGWIEAKIKTFPVIPLIPHWDEEPCGAQEAGAGATREVASDRDPVRSRRTRGRWRKGPVPGRGQGAVGQAGQDKGLWGRLSQADTGCHQGPCRAPHGSSGVLLYFVIVRFTVAKPGRSPCPP